MLIYQQKGIFAGIPTDPAKIPFYGIEKLLEISKFTFGDTDTDSDEWIHKWHNILDDLIGIET